MEISSIIYLKGLKEGYYYSTIDYFGYTLWLNPYREHNIHSDSYHDISYSYYLIRNTIPSI